MKLKKRALSLALLTALLLQSVSCGSTSSSGIDTTAASADTTDTTALSSEYTAPNVDYGGRTVTMTGYNYDGAWVILRYNVALEEENGDFINDAIVKRNRAVEEALNIKLDLIPLTVDDRGSSAVLQKYVLAQEDVVQVGMQMASGMSQLLTTEGMVVDLQEIPTLDLSHSWWNQNANEEYTLFGKQLTAIGDICLYNLGAPVVVYFSKTLVENNKLDNPYQLVYDGKWTLDTLQKMSASIANDINGNSEIDQDDIFGFAGEGASMDYFFYSSGIRYSARDKAGNIQVTLNSEKSADLAVKLVNFLLDQKTTIFNNNWSKIFTTSVFTEFMMPKLMENELLFFSNQLHVALNLRSMETNFGILPMPKYDEAQKDYIAFGNAAFCDHIVVPSTNTDLEMTGHFLEAMGYYAQQYITPAFIDVSVKDKAARDEDSVNMINLIREKQVFDVGFIFNWGAMRKNLQNLAYKNDTNFASMWASIETAVNTELEKTVSMLKGE